MEEDKSLPAVKEEDIAQELIEEKDPDKTKSLMNLFNLNFAKKNAIRLDTLSSLIDDVIAKVGERLEERPDEFSNKDLIDYLNALYQAADKSRQVVTGMDEIPAITLNQQNNVIVNAVDGLTKESKLRIAAAVNAILNQTKLQQGDSDNNGSYEEDGRDDGN